MARIAGIIISIILLGLGLLFLAAAAKSNPGFRVVTGLVALGMGSGVMWLVITKKMEVTHIQKVELTRKIDLSGEIDLGELKCQNCGAELDRNSVELREGAVFVKCPYCGADYQVVEQPKW